MEIVASSDPLLVGMLRVPLENGLGALMFTAAAALLATGLGCLLASGGEGRLGHRGYGFLILGIGVGMYPAFNILVYAGTGGNLAEIPEWLLVAPALVGPLIGVPASLWSFREARK